jgi:protein gp37
VPTEQRFSTAAIGICIAAGVEPTFSRFPETATELDITEFIRDENLERRDLDPGQRAAIRVAIDGYVEKLKGEAKERQREGGKKAGRGRPQVEAKSSQPKKRAPQVATRIAKDAKVGDSTAKQALKVKGASPQLLRDVQDGKVKLNEAYKQVRQEEARTQALKEQEKPSDRTTIVRTHDGRERTYQLPKSAPKFNFTNDQVSWAAWTWNPVTGCLHNCEYCYAREGALMNKNLKPFYPFGFDPTIYEFRLEAPANSRVPKEAKNDPRLGRVFVTSMGDLFGKWVPDDWIAKVFAAARAHSEWEYLFLTKFPQRYVGLELPPTAWIGTTVDEQYRVKIAETAFRKISGVRVKWLSLEPLLVPLKFTDLSMFDFVVIGAQSATKQPDGEVKEFAPNIEWVLEITAQAKAAGCKVYHKPNLIGVPNPQCPGMKLLQEVPILRAIGEPPSAPPPAPTADDPGGIPDFCRRNPAPVADADAADAAQAGSEPAAAGGTKH